MKKEKQWRKGHKVKDVTHNPETKENKDTKCSRKKNKLEDAIQNPVRKENKWKGKDVNLESGTKTNERIEEKTRRGNKAKAKETVEDSKGLENW